MLSDHKVRQFKTPGEQRAVSAGRNEYLKALSLPDIALSATLPLFLSKIFRGCRKTSRKPAGRYCAEGRGGCGHHKKAVHEGEGERWFQTNLLCCLRVRVRSCLHLLFCHGIKRKLLDRSVAA